MYFQLLNIALVSSSLALFGAAGYQAWQTHFDHNNQNNDSEKIHLSSAGSPQQAAKYRLQTILGANVFGTKPVIQQAPKPVVVQKTRLALKLQGMVGSTDPTLARALIRAGNSPVQSYGLGEQISETDAKIRSIEEHRVLLDRDSKVESLELDRLKLGGN